MVNSIDYSYKTNALTKEGPSTTLVRESTSLIEQGIIPLVESSTIPKETQTNLIPNESNLPHVPKDIILIIMFNCSTENSIYRTIKMKTRSLNIQNTDEKKEMNV